MKTILHQPYFKPDIILSQGGEWANESLIRWSNGWELRFESPAVSFEEHEMAIKNT